MFIICITGYLLQILSFIITLLKKLISFCLQGDKNKLDAVAPNEIAVKGEVPDVITENLQSETMEVFKEINMSKSISNQNDDSNSTFQLPPEFIADYNSDQSLPIMDTPKKLKKVNIENDRMEISTNDQIINIDLVKIQNDGYTPVSTPPVVRNVMTPDKAGKCALKFSAFDKEVLEKNNVDIDVESFKHQYLNEVDRQFNGTSKQIDVENCDLPSKVCNEDKGSKKPAKRKLPNDRVASKRRKTTKIDNKTDNNIEDRKRKIMKLKRKLKRNRANKTELSIRNKNINLKIKWKDEELNLKISKLKKKSRKDKSKVLKQYVLKYFNQNNQNGVIGKPDVDVVPIKRHYVKTEKSPDNLKQTSIDSFFKRNL